MKKVTELEHFAKKNGTSTLCIIAYKIENNNLSCSGLPCSECKFFNNGGEVLKTLLRKRVEKPKLTEDEKVILRNIDKTFKWISRDADGNLFLYKVEPTKIEGRWKQKASESITAIESFSEFIAFNHLFNFIIFEDNEPYLIEDLLQEE